MVTVATAFGVHWSVNVGVGAAALVCLQMLCRCIRPWIQKDNKWSRAQKLATTLTVEKRKAFLPDRLGFYFSLKFYGTLETNQRICTAIFCLFNKLELWSVCVDDVILSQWRIRVMFLEKISRLFLKKININPSRHTCNGLMRVGSIK